MRGTYITITDPIRQLTNARAGNVVRVRGRAGAHIITRRRRDAVRVAPLTIEPELMATMKRADMESFADVASLEDTRTVNINDITHAMRGGRR